MRSVTLTLFLAMSITFKIEASSENYAIGARHLAMGNASVTLSDVFSMHSNQAGLAFIPEFSIGISAEQRFLLAGLNNLGIVAAIPTVAGTFGISYKYFGYDLYNESKVGLAYSRLLAKGLSIGIQFDYLRIHLSEFGSKNAFTFEAGLQYQIIPELMVGMHVFNPIPIKLEEEYGERLPTIMKFGLSYRPSPKVILAAEVEQDIDRRTNFKAGLEYQFIEVLSFRGGINTGPVAGFFGFGFNMGGFHIDATASFNENLGFSPSVSLIYALPSKASE